jgi:hypothetical protein
VNKINRLPNESLTGIEDGEEIEDWAISVCITVDVLEGSWMS